MTRVGAKSPLAMGCGHSTAVLARLVRVEGAMFAERTGSAAPSGSVRVKGDVPGTVGARGPRAGLSCLKSGVGGGDGEGAGVAWVLAR